jgi:hypothetical protein
MGNLVLFGRPLKPGDPLGPELRCLLSRKARHELRAVACNLMFDQRVSLQRENALRAYFAAARNSPFEGRLQTAIREYHRERIRTAPTPEFLDTAANGENLAGTRHDGIELARILNLNGLAAAFSAARGSIDSFKDFPRQPDKPALTSSPYDLKVLRWLDERLGASGSNRDSVIRDVLLALNKARVEKPYEPAWATTWGGFGPVRTEGPRRWCQVVGVVNTGGTARWVLVLRYRLPPGWPLVRPTILDAGYNAYHFPSPPYQRRKTGHPMDLRYTPLPQQLRREFIHRQIDHHPDHWEAAGRLLDRTDGPLPGRIGLRRRAHLQLLAKHYKSGIQGWMDRSL